MDLHIHTCLSPCGDLSMLPTAVVERARQAGLDAIGICDHNTAGNVSAVQEAGRRRGLPVLGGMEITTAEEVHVLALFDRLEDLQRLESLVREHLSGDNDPEAWGEQILVDADDEPVGIEERLLTGAVGLGIHRIVGEIRALGGLAVAAHVDKPVFSVVSQLGFVPPELPLDAAELSAHHGDLNEYLGWGLPLLTFSDAHFLEEIGRGRTLLRAHEGTVEELRLALQGRDGRSVAMRAAEE